MNARKLKSGCDFSFPSHTCAHPNFPLLLSSFVPQKSSHFSYFLGCIRSPAAPFLLSLFLSFFSFPSSPLLTRQPSLPHQNKISLPKEEIKGLTLKFEGLMILWFIECLIAYFSMFIIGIKVPK